MQEVGSDDEDSSTLHSDAPQTVELELSSLVETVFDGGLSAALVSTLRVVVAKVPGLQAQVQSSLLKQVARALRQFTTEPVGASAASAASTTTAAAAGAAATAGHSTTAVQQRPRVGSFHQLTALDSPRIKRQPFAAAAASGGSESSGGGGGAGGSTSSSKPADKSWTSFLFQQHTHASTAEVVVDDEPESSEVSETTTSSNGADHVICLIVAVSVAKYHLAAVQ
jgi:hypothetical protein